jgi:hypothetical protein
MVQMSVKATMTATKNAAEVVRPDRPKVTT